MAGEQEGSGWAKPGASTALSQYAPGVSATRGTAQTCLSGQVASSLRDMHSRCRQSTALRADSGKGKTGLQAWWTRRDQE